MMRSLRMNALKVALAVLFFCLAMPALVFAQDEAPQGPDWGAVIAIAINSVLVVVVLELMKMVLPGLSPFVKQLLAFVAGPSLTWLATYLSGVLGHPIDFSAIIALFAGLGSAPLAMGLFDTIGRVTVKPVRKALERAIGRAA